MLTVAVEDVCPEDNCKHTKGITTAGKNQNKQRILKPWEIYKHCGILRVEHINLLNTHAVRAVG